VNKLLSSEEKYRKSIHEVSVEIGDKIYWAKIETEYDGYSYADDIISMEDDFGAEIENWSEEISEEIMEAYNNAIIT
tara:strand:- start:1084 stop:1314 length:231 start_codon:yes stop_codon:yes gene_type:complete